MRAGDLFAMTLALLRPDRPCAVQSVEVWRCPTSRMLVLSQQVAGDHPDVGVARLVVSGPLPFPEYAAPVSLLDLIEHPCRSVAGSRYRRTMPGGRAEAVYYLGSAGSIHRVDISHVAGWHRGKAAYSTIWLRYWRVTVSCSERPCSSVGVEHSAAAAR